jgi:uncharacterized protein (TIGR03083 family)
MTPTTITTTHDYPALVRAELADLRALLPQLTEDQWETPSLCEGWRVRDVIGHACTGYTYSIPKVAAMTARAGFRVPKAAGAAAVEFADSRTTPELVEAFNTATTPDKPKGFVKTVAWRDRLVDHMIHEQDIRRPLGIPREFPPERLRAALDVLHRIGGFTNTRARVKGLRLVATDLDHAVGDGPEVRGPAAAIILAAGGRTASLPELEGDGVTILRERISG